MNSFKPLLTSFLQGKKLSMSASFFVFLQINLSFLLLGFSQPIMPVVDCSSNATDDFSTDNYTSGFGWVGDWVEVRNGSSASDPDGDDAGLIQIVAGQLRFKGVSGVDPYIIRTVDLEDATSAQLTFNLLLTATDANTDVFRLQISSNGGRTWDYSESYSGLTGVGLKTVNLLPYASDKTTIRFEVESFANATGEFFFVDNVAIAATCIPPDNDPGNFYCSASSSQITGNVFEDYNYDGLYDDKEHLGVSSITVTATDSFGNSISTTTNSSGNYTLNSLVSGRDYRVEFTNIPATFIPGVYGDDNGTQVQFVTAGSCADLALIDTTEPCYYNGFNIGDEIGEAGVWKYIGDINNPADGSSYSTTINGSPVVHNNANQIGYGSVDYEYWIQDRQITLGDYLAFLNHVDPTNGSEKWEGGLLDEGIVEYYENLAIGDRWVPGSYSCGTQNIDYLELDKTVVNFISFILAARFSNWAATGDINQGAYTFASPTAVVTHITAIDNTWTGIRMPTEDEMYKAIYWDEANNTYNLFGTTTLQASGNPIQSLIDNDGLYTVANGNVYGLSSAGGCFYLWQPGQGGPTPYGLYGTMGDSHDIMLPKNTTIPTSFHVVRPGNQFNGVIDMRSSYRLSTDLAYNGSNGIWYPSPGFRLSSGSNPCDWTPSIGNRVWEDTNRNGIQEAGEAGLANVRVELYDATGNFLAYHTTNSLGEYYFTEDGVGDAVWQTSGDALEPNTSYYIVAGGNGQFSGGELSLGGNTYDLTQYQVNSGANRYELDSDGTIASGIDPDFNGEPYAQITTGDYQDVNYSYDFGFSLSCELAISATATDVECFGNTNGSITTSITTSGATPYDYIWSNGAASSNISNLSAGTYTVTVTDANNCTATAEAQVIQPTSINIVLTPNHVTVKHGYDGSISSSISGGTPTYGYQWSNGETTANINNLSAATYTVTVTDSNDCTQSAEVTITQPACPPNVRCGRVNVTRN